MIIIDSIYKLNIELKKLRRNGNLIAFIPTMGRLHKGHISLVKYGAKFANKIVVSIFINPTQFNEEKDFLNYPKNIERDINILKYYKVDLLFIPTVDMMYPNGLKNCVVLDIPNLSNILEGEERERHFSGVITVVSKFFNIIKPDLACFGQKDFQQLFLIKRLNEDMHYNIKIIEVPTVRDSTGLALSSRNELLSKEEKNIASNLNNIIKNLSKDLNIKNIKKKIKSTKNQLNNYGFKSNKIFICDAENLSRIEESTKKIVIIVTVRLGNVRLTDNILFYYN